jgi:ribosomal subunit interface protein
MRVEIRGQNVGLTAALEEYAMRRFTTALGRFDKRVSSVTIRFVDENGPRGGVDKHCQAELHMPRLRVVMIDEQNKDLYAAIDAAADRAARIVTREIGRRRAKRVEAAEYRAAEKTGVSQRPAARAS